MSRGSKNVIVRFPPEELAALVAQMNATNLTRRDEPYTVSSYVRECVRQQLQKNQRGRRPYGRRLARRQKAETTEMDFDRIWERLSEQGVCDSLWSCEYARVLTKWIKAGCPDPAGYIVREANIPP